ncbi:MAG: hypothetical protein CR991_04945 [Proteobacteria bacterium]|nr:MAG: hypothetical protein CR991_04945 [Pseudomonadota bacterium]
MKKLNVLLMSAVLAVAASQTQAAPSNNTVHFKAPAIGGSGCPSGTSDYAITPDGQTLSILFDQYIASPGMAACNIAIPVHVPNGFQVSLLTADYRGFVEGKAELSRSYFFAGGNGPSKRTTLKSSGGKDYLERDKLLAWSHIYSKCGKDVNMRINSRIRTLTNSSVISVDSLDLNNGMIFHLQYQPC